MRPMAPINRQGSREYDSEVVSSQAAPPASTASETNAGHAHGAGVASTGAAAAPALAVEVRSGGMLGVCSNGCYHRECGAWFQDPRALPSWGEAPGLRTGELGFSSWAFRVSSRVAWPLDQTSCVAMHYLAKLRLGLGRLRRRFRLAEASDVTWSLAGVRNCKLLQMQEGLTSRIPKS